MLTLLRLKSATHPTKPKKEGIHYRLFLAIATIVPLLPDPSGVLRIGLADSSLHSCLNRLSANGR